MQHPRAQALERLERRVERDFECKSLVRGARSTDILDDLGGEDGMTNPDILAVHAAEGCRKELHLGDSVGVATGRF